MGFFRIITAALLAVFIPVSSFAMGGKEGSSAAEATAVPVVVVSILPQAYFVERIAGDRVRPVVLVGPGQSPHAYEPTPRQMAELSSASMWLTIRADFEVALRPKVESLYPNLTIVDTTTDIAYRDLDSHGHEGEDDGHDDEDESGIDPHVWLGRQAVKAMAASIRDALSTADPAGEAVFAANHDAFVRDVDAVFSSLARELAPLRGKPVFVYHPSFGYFLDEFGIEQESVETGGKEPTQKALAALIGEAKHDGAQVIFVQPQFPASAARTVAQAIGGIVVEIDALAPDWLDNIRRIGAALGQAAR